MIAAFHPLGTVEKPWDGADAIDRAIAIHTCSDRAGTNGFLDRDALALLGIQETMVEWQCTMSSVSICSRSDVGMCRCMGQEGQVDSCVFFLRFMSMKNVSDGCDGEQWELG